jgi:hypothetical protein
MAGAQPLQQHRARVDHRDRVGQIAARDVGRRAVGGLGHGHLIGRVDRGGDAERSGDLAGQVGEDVAHHVLGDQHVEVGRPPDEVDGHGVDVEVVNRQLRVLTGDLTADVAEQAGGQLEHVGLVHDREVLPPPAGQVDGDPRDPLGGRPGDDAERDGHVRGGHELAAAGVGIAVSVEALGVLADDDEIRVGRDGPGALEASGRADVGE